MAHAAARATPATLAACIKKRGEIYARRDARIQTSSVVARVYFT